MADIKSTNTNNDLTPEPKVRQLTDIFDDLETTDYDPSGSVSEGRPVRPLRSRVASVEPSKATPREGQRPGRSSASRSASPSRSSSHTSRSASSRTGQSSRSFSAARSSRTGASRSGSGSRSASRSSLLSRTSRTGRSSESSRSAASSGRSRAGYRSGSVNRKKQRFKKMLLLYIAVLVVILIVGSIIFSIYLGSYENGLPSHVAESIVKSYESQEGIVKFVTANADKTTIIDNVAETAEVYATNIAGKTISYIENGEYRANAPAYDIMADGATVAKVTLGHEGNSSKWSVTSLNISEYLPNSMSVIVKAPQGSTVSVNGRTLDATYITSSGVPEVLENSLSFIAAAPQYDTYQLSGLVTEPQVTVTDAAGNSMFLSQNDNTYIASQPADAAFIDSVEDRVYAAIDSYATYFINMSFDLKNYIALNSDLWTYIFGSDTMDPIATSLYMFEDIASYDFAMRNADHYVKYAEDCFTVDIQYALDMVFTNPNYSDDNQKMDATWVFVIDPYDGSWCISDIINH